MTRKPLPVWVRKLIPTRVVKLYVAVGFWWVHRPKVALKQTLSWLIQK